MFIETASQCIIINIDIFMMTSDYCCMFLCSFYNAIAR